MSFIENVGEVSFSSEGVHWTIPNFSQLPHMHDTDISSPVFEFENRKWRLRIFPNGDSSESSLDWFGIEAWSSFPFTPIEGDIHLGIADEQGRSIVSSRAEREGCTYTCMKLIPHAEFQTRRNEFFPGGTLHILLTVVNNDVCKITGDLERMLLNECLTDVILTVQGREFKAHRFILAARSPVFLAMMTHDTKEKATGVVDIEDGDPDIFPDFLHFLYTGKINNLTSENALKLYTVADKYQVGHLKQKCVDYMLRNISIENFCDVFSLSLQHNEKELKDACLSFFQDESLNIIMTTSWQNFLCENPITGNELFIKHLQVTKSGGNKP